MHTTRVLSRRGFLGASVFLTGCSVLERALREEERPRAALLLDLSRSVRLADSERITVVLQFVSRLGKGTELAIIPVNANNAGMLTAEVPSSDPTGYGDVFRERVYEPVHSRLKAKFEEWSAAGSDESNYEGAVERAAQFLAQGKGRVLAIIGDMEHDVKGRPSRDVNGDPRVPSFADSKLDLSDTKVFIGIVEGNSGKPSQRFLAKWRKELEGAHAKEVLIAKYGLDGFKDWCAQKLGPANPAFDKWARGKGVSL